MDPTTAWPTCCCGLVLRNKRILPCLSLFCQEERWGTPTVHQLTWPEWHHHQDSPPLTHLGHRWAPPSRNLCRTFVGPPQWIPPGPHPWRALLEDGVQQPHWTLQIAGNTLWTDHCPSHVPEPHHYDISDILVWSATVVKDRHYIQFSVFSRTNSSLMMREMNEKWGFLASLVPFLGRLVVKDGPCQGFGHWQRIPAWCFFCNCNAAIQRFPSSGPQLWNLPSITSSSASPWPQSCSSWTRISISRPPIINPVSAPFLPSVCSSLAAKFARHGSTCQGSWSPAGIAFKIHWDVQASPPTTRY